MTWIVGRNGVREGVREDDLPLRDALQAGHLDVVRLERLDHRGAHHPLNVRDDDDDECRHREHEEARLAPRVGPGAIGATAGRR